MDKYLNFERLRDYDVHIKKCQLNYKFFFFLIELQIFRILSNKLNLRATDVLKKIGIDKVDITPFCDLFCFVVC